MHLPRRNRRKNLNHRKIEREIYCNMETKMLLADAAGIALAVRTVADGGLAALPTETVYGIAADATNGKAVKEIFIAKGRPQDNPLIVHIGNIEMMEGLVARVPERARKLAEAFWPGPLTIIMPRGEKVADEVCAGLDSVGIRMPCHPVIRAYFAAGGLAFAAPSANLSGSPSPTTAADVLADMNGRLPLILDGGECDVGVESTVISVTGEQPILLRPGYVTREQMEEVLGEKVLLSHAILEKLKEGEEARSPGMKYKHYAPKADITIVKGSLEAFAAYVGEHSGDENIWCLCFAGEEKILSTPCVPYGSCGDGVSQAHDLFRSLRLLDENGAKIVYARCPELDGVSMAVYNRLIRAAAFKVVEL